MCTNILSWELTCIVVHVCFHGSNKKRSDSQNNNAEAIWWVYLFSLFLFGAVGWIEEGRRLAFCR